MDSVFEELAKQFEGKAVVGRINNSEKDLFQVFGVRLLPTIYLIRNAEIKETMVGMQTKQHLNTILTKYQ